MKILIDICGTMFDSNTTFDFLDYYLKTKNYIRFRRLTHTLPWRTINKLCMFFRFDLTRTIAIRYLQGHSKEKLQSTAQEFYTDILIPKKITTVWNEIDKLENRKQIIIISATLDFIAETVAHKNNIEQYYSSQLQYDEQGICMGILSSDLLGSKHLFLSTENILPPYQMTITDNCSDIELARLSEKKIIISNKKRINWWKKRLPIISTSYIITE